MSVYLNEGRNLPCQLDVTSLKAKEEHVDGRVAQDLVRDVQAIGRPRVLSLGHGGHKLTPFQSVHARVVFRTAKVCPCHLPVAERSSCTGTTGIGQTADHPSSGTMPPLIRQGIENATDPAFGGTLPALGL